MFSWTAGHAGSPLDGLALLAYLDPGTGSFAIQMLLAGVFGGMFALKQSWSGLRLWTSARFGQGGAEGRRPSRVERPPVHGRTSPGG